MKLAFAKLSAFEQFTWGVLIMVLLATGAVFLDRVERRPEQALHVNALPLDANLAMCGGGAERPACDPRLLN